MLTFLSHMYTYDVPAEIIYHHLLNGELRPARVDDVIRPGTVCCGRNSEAYTLCQNRSKFNKLGQSLSKAFKEYVADVSLLSNVSQNKYHI